MAQQAPTCRAHRLIYGIEQTAHPLAAHQRLSELQIGARRVVQNKILPNFVELHSADMRGDASLSLGQVAKDAARRRERSIHALLRPQRLQKFCDFLLVQEKAVHHQIALDPQARRKLGLVTLKKRLVLWAQKTLGFA